MRKIIKNSKKAFTLVELVVVIAVLAIIAAIAIPSVITVIASSTESQGVTDAQTLSEACENFYVAVSTGEVNTLNFTKATGSSMRVPTKTATYTSRKACAKTATIADVLKYNGLAEGILNDKRYATATTTKYEKGDIIYLTTAEDDTAQLTSSTQLKEIFIG